MGDPRKIKKKFFPPAHPWVRSIIEENKILREEYGLRRKKEVLLASSFLKKYKDLAKHLIADKTVQGEKEKKQIMDKLQRYGLLQAGASLDNILSIQLKDVLERRIQSLVFRKGHARSMDQARQFITHRHIMIGDKEITSPGYMLTLEEESKLAFKQASTLASAEHPERILLPKKETPKIEVRPERDQRRGGRRDFKKNNSQRRPRGEKK